MLSVVICTHNPRSNYLERTLGALRTQTLPSKDWELLVIDNASREPLSKRLDLSWHGAARVVREDRLGLTPARLRGIREALGDLLVFVDDDNVLDSDYLEVACCVAKERSWLGSWSGQCRPEFERNPPGWTRRYWGNLVIREFDRDAWSNLPRLADTMPCGAGLCVRRSVAQEYLRLNESNTRSFQLDRTGSSLLSGGDNDLAACACDLGLGMGVITSLRLTHLIPPERMTVEYFKQLTEGIYFSTVVLAHVRSSTSELSLLSVRWHETLRCLLKPSPHRSIQLAALRGRRKGLQFVSKLL